MGAINLDHSGSGNDVTLSAVSGALRANGVAVPSLVAGTANSSTGALDLATGTVFAITPTSSSLTLSFSNVPASAGLTATLAFTNVATSSTYVVGSTIPTSTSTVYQQSSGILWSADGSRLYIAPADYGAEVIYGTTTTPFDVSTISSYSLISIPGLFGAFLFNDLAFNGDGTILYLSDGNAPANYSLIKCTLSTPYDITSVASATTQTNGFTYPYKSFCFVDNGNYIYFRSTNDGTIYCYSLSVPYDLSSTKTSIGSITVSGGTGALRANPEGTRIFYVYSSSQIGTYTVSSPATINSPTPAGLVNFVNSVNGFTFYSSGANITLFPNGYANNYSSSTTPTLATLSFPSSVKWAGGTAPTNPADGVTDLYSFTTVDAGTTWYGVVLAQALS